MPTDSFDEFFGMHEYMKQFPNYFHEYHLENPTPLSFREISSFFIPAEIFFETMKQEHLIDICE